MMMRGAPLLAMAASLSLACASARREAYVAPGPSTVFVETDERQTDPAVHIVSIVNLSSDPVFVWSLMLNRCENIKQPCEARPVELRIPPQGRQVALRVEPALQAHRFSYRFSFAWRVDSVSNSVVRTVNPPRP